MSTSLVIFSGGQDSTTCLYWALDGFDSVEAITFAYGQKHSIEVECAKAICEREGVKQTIIDISFLGTIVDSALTSNGDVKETNKKGLPASYVPNRNALFMTLAHAYAQKIEAEDIVSGVCQTDFSGYPDCREYFVSMMNHALDAGSDSKIKVHTPLMHLNKADTFMLARDLGHLKEVVELSHTCYNGDRTHLHQWGYGCNDCPACELRRAGWIKYIEQELPLF